MGDTERDLDRGAYIGQEPELEEESIPGGVQPGDERIAAYGSQRGVEGEPDGSSDQRLATRDAVERPAREASPR